ncbi:MAG: asparagine synthase (glutamine-hydrolyzing) [Microcystis aeruginosa Ma_AC_P_19900807_S300]|nr:MAG: asparagine synthase (glutamine-hydrolyzing) [Microcystis aeruginosa Ma_AC_P_19900807_S300]
MCGIIGSWSKTNPKNIDSMIAEGLMMLNHRGPDDKGYETIETAAGIVFMGQTRLSIIDLTEGGHQPMSTSDGRFVIVFNGEIYNYKELRSELIRLGYIFKSESDTEVLLASWSQWGKDCLIKLVGMFSFAILDTRSETLTLVRDAFGIKPLFYYHNGTTLAFSSEIQTVMHLSNEELSINNQRVYEYLIYAVQDIGEDTFIQDIHHVPPSHLVVLNLNNPDTLTLEKWWTPSIVENKQISFEAAVEKLRYLFLENIRYHLMSDVPVGVALSGGIDSSGIACAIRFLEPNMDIHTFSFIPEGSQLSEEKWIDIVNSHIKAIPHKAFVKAGELKSDIFDLVNSQGEPFCTTSMYAQYRVFQLAKDIGIKVVLEGQGADEILAGYQGYHGQRMRSLFEQGNIRGMIKFASRWKKWHGRENKSAWKAFIGQVIPDSTYKRVQSITAVQKIPDWINQSFLRKININERPIRTASSRKGRKRRVAEVLYDSLTNYGLPSLLRYGDRNAMRFSIENRVPFLTIPLAEFLLTLPEEFLISQDGETKSIFRAAMRGIVPDIILDRRDKVGFEVPMGKWVYEMKKEINEVEFLPDDLNILDLTSVKRILSENIHNQEKMPLQHWRLINLMLWYKEVLKKHNQRNK